MLLKPGVDISRLNRQIRRTLNSLDRIFKNYGEHLVITSTYEGSHSPSSLHYANNAIDLRLPTTAKLDIYQDIKDNIGDDYDVILEIDHIHIEYDPKQ